MSHTTEAESYKKELEELRELHRQTVEDMQKAHDQLTMASNQKDLDNAETIEALKLQIPVTSFNTPVPRNNLSNQMSYKPQVTSTTTGSTKGSTMPSVNSTTGSLSLQMRQ